LVLKVSRVVFENDEIPEEGLFGFFIRWSQFVDYLASRRTKLNGLNGLTKRIGTCDDIKREEQSHRQKSPTSGMARIIKAIFLNLTFIDAANDQAHPPPEAEAMEARPERRL